MSSLIESPTSAKNSPGIGSAESDPADPQWALRVTRIDTDAALAPLRAEWNALAGDSPFRQWEWLECWWRHYRTRRCKLLVLAVRDGSGRLVGLAPWYVHSSNLAGKLVQWLGSGEVASEYLAVTAAPGSANAVAQAIAAWLLGPGRNAWDLLRLADLDPADSVTPRLVQQLAGRSTQIQREGATRWVLPLPGSWEEYIACRSSSTRTRLRKTARRFEPAGDVTLHEVTQPAQLEMAWNVLIDLHQRRRGSCGDPGCFASPRFVAYHREMIAILLEQKRLLLQWVEVAGQPIGVYYQIAQPGVVTIYQTGMDPDQSEHSPGWLNLIASVRTAIARGASALDLLRGDESYKSMWRFEPHPSVSFDIIAPRALAGWRYRTSNGARAAWGSLRRLVKRLLPWQGLRRWVRRMSHRVHQIGIAVFSIADLHSEIFLWT